MPVWDKGEGEEGDVEARKEGKGGGKQGKRERKKDKGRNKDKMKERGGITEMKDTRRRAD